MLVKKWKSGKGSFFPALGGRQCHLYPRLFRLMFVLVTMSLIWFGCNPEQFRDKSQLQSQFVIIGIDGADWKFIEQNIAAGKLPYFQQLISNGSSGELETLAPCLSPVLWTSAVTGKNMDKHGITGFVSIDNEHGRSRLNNSRTRLSTPFWQMVSLYNRSVLWLNWFFTWPSDPVKGALVSDRYLYTPDTNLVYPEIMPIMANIGIRTLPRFRNLNTSELDQILGKQISLSDLKENKNLQTILEKITFDITCIDLLEKLARRYPAQITGIYLRGLDIIQHYYWKYYEPQGFVVSETDLRQYRRVISRSYRLYDGLIGRIMGIYPDNTNFIVLSDHGFSSMVNSATSEYLQESAEYDNQGKIITFRYPEINRILEKMGWVTLTGESELVLDDTKIYAISKPRHWDAYFYVTKSYRNQNNQLTMEGKNLLQTFRQDIQAVMADPGQIPVFIDVTEDTSKSGDMQARINPAITSDTNIVLNGKRFPAREFFHVFDISGGHNENTAGIIIFSGNLFRKQKIEADISLLDITPTLLYALQLPVAKDMDGRIVSSIFNPQHFQISEPQFINSYDDINPAWHRPGTPEAKEPSDVDRKLREQLKSLGYINE